MLKTMPAPASTAIRTPKGTSSRMLPSPVAEQPFTWKQELNPFATWTGKPLWVPPKNASRELAKTMLDQCGVFASKDSSWEKVVEVHRAKFTQVRQIELTILLDFH